MNDFFGVCSSKRKLKEDIHTFDLSPFFKNKNFKKKVIKDDFFIFGYLSKKPPSNRLSTLQPYYNQNKSICLISDSRIDNRDELIKKIYNESVKSGFDISNEELISKAYEKWGIKFSQYIIGDFVIVIWDNVEKQLVCTRDRIGIKTLYYHIDNGFFSFATELFPLLQLANHEHRPNINSMKQFLQFPTQLEFGETMYEGINTLPAAHTLILKNGSIILERYWFPEKIKIDKSISFEEAKKTFYQLFQNAIRCRMDTSSPTGIDLSGGLDSSSVVAVAQENDKISPIISCSIKYGDYECDETEYINSLLDRSGVENINIKGDKVDFKSTYNLDYIYKLNPVWPNFVNSAVAIPLAEKLQDKGINVVLTGLGGDETLTGSAYAFTDYFKTYQWLDLFHELKNYRFNIKIIYKYIVVTLLSKKQKKFLKNILFALHPGKKEINPMNSSFVDIDACSSYEQAAHLKTITSKYFSFAMNALHLHALKEHNIEFRHPFYDTYLIEFLLSLPPGYRFKNGIKKRLLRESMKNLLPYEIYSRNDKAEFSEVVYEQIKSINLDEFWENKYIAKLCIVTEQEIENIIRKFKNMTNKRDYTVITPLWRLINLEKWYRVNFVDFEQRT